MFSFADFFRRSSSYSLSSRAADAAETMPIDQALWQKMFAYQEPNLFADLVSAFTKIYGMPNDRSLWLKSMREINAKVAEAHPKGVFETEQEAATRIEIEQKIARKFQLLYACYILDFFPYFKDTHQQTLNDGVSVSMANSEEKTDQPTEDAALFGEEDLMSITDDLDDTSFEYEQIFKSRAEKSDIEEIAELEAAYEVITQWIANEQSALLDKTEGKPPRTEDSSITDIYTHAHRDFEMEELSKKVNDLMTQLLNKKLKQLQLAVSNVHDARFTANTPHDSAPADETISLASRQKDIEIKEEKEEKEKEEKVAVELDLNIPPTLDRGPVRKTSAEMRETLAELTADASPILISTPDNNETPKQQPVPFENTSIGNKQEESEIKEEKVEVVSADLGAPPISDLGAPSTLEREIRPRRTSSQTQEIQTELKTAEAPKQQDAHLADNKKRSDSLGQLVEKINSIPLEKLHELGQYQKEQEIAMILGKLLPYPTENLSKTASLSQDTPHDKTVSIAEMSSIFASLRAEQDAILEAFKEIYTRLCAKCGLNEKYVLQQVEAMQSRTERNLLILVNSQLGYDKGVARHALQLAQQHYKQWENLELDTTLHQDFKTFVTSFMKTHASRLRFPIQKDDTMALWLTSMADITALKQDNIYYTAHKEQLDKFELLFACHVLNIHPAKAQNAHDSTAVYLKAAKENNQEKSELAAAYKVIQNWQEQWRLYNESKDHSVYAPFSGNELSSFYFDLRNEQSVICNAFKATYKTMCMGNAQNHNPLLAQLQALPQTTKSISALAVHQTKQPQRDMAKQALSLAMKHYHEDLRLTLTDQYAIVDAFKAIYKTICVGSNRDYNPLLEQLVQLQLKTFSPTTHSLCLLIESQTDKKDRDIAREAFLLARKHYKEDLHLENNRPLYMSAHQQARASAKGLFGFGFTRTNVDYKRDDMMDTIQQRTKPNRSGNMLETMHHELDEQSAQNKRRRLV